MKRSAAGMSASIGLAIAILPLVSMHVKTLDGVGRGSAHGFCLGFQDKMDADQEAGDMTSYHTNATREQIIVYSLSLLETHAQRTSEPGNE